MKKRDTLSVYDDSTVGDMLEKRVMQANAITSGRYDFSACQLDILFMLLSQLSIDKMTYRIYTKDIELITGRSWNYAQLRQATEDMGCRMFEIETEKKLTQLWLFQKIDYLIGEGAFEVMLSEPAKPYFFELKNNFTTLQLKSVLSCSSKYAKRLYGLACQWRSTGRQVYLIEDLKRMLGLIDKKGFEQYTQIGQFKEKVLDIAKTQINELTDVHFDYVLHKRGRSFTHIEILINAPAVKNQLQIDFQRDIDEQKYIREIMAYGLSELQATPIAKKVPIKDFRTFVATLKEKARINEITLENTTAYIVGAYKKMGIIS